MASFPLQAVPVTRFPLCLDQRRDGSTPGVVPDIGPEGGRDVDIARWDFHYTSIRFTNKRSGIRTIRCGPGSQCIVHTASHLNTDYRLVGLQVTRSR